MQELTSIAGLAVTVAGARLHFHEAMTPARLSVRRAADLAAVWRDAPASPQNPELYAAYWGSLRAADEPAFRQHRLDHVYVLIHPGVYGGEYFKTQGHYHPPLDAASPGHPELYHVLAGRGLFLLQRAVPPHWQVQEAIVIDVTPDDVIVVPPNYGHLTVNYGEKPLVFEAFLADNLSPVTTPYRERRGGACYCLATADGPQVIANPLYGPDLVVRRVKAPAWQRASATPEDAFYRSVVRQLERFTWLRDPAAFDAVRIAQDLGLATDLLYAEDVA
jgi:glucose-6-phosphate isomerase